MPINLDNIPDPIDPTPRDPSEFDGGRAINPDQFPASEGGEQPIFKPHAFALTHGDRGAKVAYGELHYGVTIQTVTRTEINGQKVVESITQEPIQETRVKVPEWEGTPLDPKIPNNYTQLDGYGEIYLYWEYSLGSGGTITVCEIRVGRPEAQDITFLNEDLLREEVSGSGGSGSAGCIGKFAIKLGTVEEGSEIEQNVAGDVPWFAHVIQDIDNCAASPSSSSSSSSSSSGSSSDSSAPPSSSSKSTCIVGVPKWFHATGFAALFIMESPEVRFEDFQQVEITGRITKVPVDPRFVVVCEPGTLNVRSAQGRRPVAYGSWIGHDGYLYLDSGLLWRFKRGKVNVSITGIRRGFLRSSKPGDPFYDTRFPARSFSQFADNEKFINQAYSRPEDSDA